MSAISSVYDALAAMEVGSAKLTATDVTSVKLINYLDGDLPKRLLMPKTEGDMAFIAIGDLQKVTWVIQDLCLISPVTSDFGVHQHASTMMTYLSDYLTAIKALRNPATGCVVTGVGVEILPVLWGEKTYWAVDVSLTVEERL